MSRNRKILTLETIAFKCFQETNCQEKLIATVKAVCAFLTIQLEAENLDTREIF